MGKFRLELCIEGKLPSYGTPTGVTGKQKARAVLIMSEGESKPSFIKDRESAKNALLVHYELGEHESVDANIAGAGIVTYLADAFESERLLLMVSEWEVIAY